jgi:beta-galactosidase
VTRYCEDVGHPTYQEAALALAERLVTRYAGWAGVAGIAVDNELGAGHRSYSESARTRFVEWLRERYGDVDALNRAWFAQFWSRRLRTFEEAYFGLDDGIVGSPAHRLDTERFFSEEIRSFILALRRIVHRVAPDLPTPTNHWPDFPGYGFDYLRDIDTLVDVPCMGFYPGADPDNRALVVSTCMYLRHRCGTRPRPAWCSEFQTGAAGVYAPPEGAIRMYAYLAAAHGAEAILAWTWQTLPGGEEQFLYGLLDHDGAPSTKLDEWRTIAAEWRTLDRHNVDLNTNAGPGVAIGYSYDARAFHATHPLYFDRPYDEGIVAVFDAFFRHGVAVTMVDPTGGELDPNREALAVLPGLAVFPHGAERPLDEYARAGGSVLMTAQSAVVDESATAYRHGLPGGYAELAGIGVRGFERPRAAKQCVRFGERAVEVDTTLVELIEPTADSEVVATIRTDTGEHPLLTRRRPYDDAGGSFWYLAVRAEPAFLDLLCSYVARESGVVLPPAVPNVYRKRLASGHELIVNLSGGAVTVETAPGGDGPVRNILSRNVLSGAVLGTRLELEPYGVAVTSRE